MGDIRDIGTDTINAAGEAMEVASDAVESRDIQSNAVTTSKIADTAVTNAKLASPKIGVIQETVAVADFTDVDTTGYIDLSTDIPAGAIVMQIAISAVTGFAGDTSATLTVGDGSDVDRYNTGTPNVFTTAAHISAGAVSGTAYNLTAVTPRVTVTSATDFSAVVTDGNGEATITIFYYTV